MSVMLASTKVLSLFIMPLFTWLAQLLPQANRAALQEDRVVWYVVAAWVLIGLGATIILGAIAWCFMNAHDGLYAAFSINPWQFKVGCY